MIAHWDNVLLPYDPLRFGLTDIKLNLDTDRNYQTSQGCPSVLVAYSDNLTIEHSHSN